MSSEGENPPRICRSVVVANSGPMRSLQQSRALHFDRSVGQSHLDAKKLNLHRTAMRKLVTAKHATLTHVTITSK